MSECYGLMAEFMTADALVKAANRARERGFEALDAYAPFPVEGLPEAVGFRNNRVPLIVLLGGIAGGLGGYFLQWYSAVVSYPINVGGRPLHSWPSFIPVTFELTVLGAAVAGVVGMLVLNGLPCLYHPVFNARDFDLATRNRFFLCIRSEDRLFAPDETRRFLESLEPLRISEVAQ
jgi:hypothetical protein